MCSVHVYNNTRLASDRRGTLRHRNTSTLSFPRFAFACLPPLASSVTPVMNLQPCRWNHTGSSWTAFSPNRQEIHLEIHITPSYPHISLTFSEFSLHRRRCLSLNLRISHKQHITFAPGLSYAKMLLFSASAITLVRVGCAVVIAGLDLSRVSESRLRVT